MLVELALKSMKISHWCTTKRLLEVVTLWVRFSLFFPISFCDFFLISDYLAQFEVGNHRLANKKYMQAYEYDMCLNTTTVIESISCSFSILVLLCFAIISP
jgi:hypothetical protein